MAEMIGIRTLLVNPPLVGGIAFTRQGRCQEREEVLGTTKPPYTLALAAALLRDRGCQVRLADLDGLYQKQAASRMSVSRQTFGRIVEAAHRKIADVIVNGKALRIEGGPVSLAGAEPVRCPRTPGLACGEGNDPSCPHCSKQAEN